MTNNTSNWRIRKDTNLAYNGGCRKFFIVKRMWDEIYKDTILHFKWISQKWLLVTTKYQSKGHTYPPNRTWSIGHTWNKLPTSFLSQWTKAGLLLGANFNPAHVPFEICVDHYTERNVKRTALGWTVTENHIPLPSSYNQSYSHWIVMREVQYMVTSRNTITFECAPEQGSEKNSKSRRVWLCNN